MPQPQFLFQDFELFYLVELTRQKVKPLGRWEKPLNEEAIRWLRRQDLVVDAIPRKTLLRKHIQETIFSTSSRYVDFYRRKFFNAPLCKDPATQRLEGFLFGYPSCCVEQFIQHPYSHNHLSKEDQALLFYWVCPNCRVTSEILPYYHSIHRQVQEWYEKEIRPLQVTGVRSPERSPRKAALAAAVAICLAAGALHGQTSSDSTHFIPVPNDADSDGLTYAEEFYLGTEFTSPFSQALTMNDGEFWSLFFNSIIDTLPTTPQTNQPYKLEFFANGVEFCQKCGAAVNMGFVTLVNPLRDLQLDIPFIGLHYLENGCFSYWGDIHNGRVEIDTLKKILYPYDPAHLLPVTGDSDSDGLTDAEEDSLYLNPANPDTDGDGVPDGPGVAEQLIRLFPKLKEQADNIHSSINFLWVYGVENCQICGSVHNMGSVEFQNPENGQIDQIHFNGLHAMAHGSFAYDGTVWPNQRADAVELYRTMKTHILFISDDSDDDGLTDVEEQYFGFDPNEADSDGDGICDGTELALTFTGIIDTLPTSPVSTGPYVIHHPTFGFWNCLLCGEPVNMGFMEIFNSGVGSDPLTITYYAHHFLKKGSFAYEGRIDGGSWIEGRIDPVQLAAYLDYLVGTQSGTRETLPEGFVLEQNYPNPFNPETTIAFRLPSAEHVRIVVYTITGQQVAAIVDKNYPAGDHKVKFDVSRQAGISSGIYLYQIQTERFRQTKKMVLLR